MGKIQKQERKIPVWQRKEESMGVPDQRQCEERKRREVQIQEQIAVQEPPEVRLPRDEGGEEWVSILVPVQNRRSRDEVTIQIRPVSLQKPQRVSSVEIEANIQALKRMKTVFVELKIPMCVPTDSSYKPSHNNPSSHHVTITGVLFSRAAPPS